MPPTPTDETVHRVHDRYLKEVVEDLGLCPFARRCRETGRLRRPLFRAHDGGPAPAECLGALRAIAETQPDIEVVLLTFVLPDRHAFWEPAAFDRFLQALREEAEGALPVRFYLVGFHPASDSSALPGALRPQTLPPLLRRTPDPVVQCVRGDLLDGLRHDPGRWERLIEGEPDAEIRELLAASRPVSSPVSDDIAEENFRRVGAGEGFRELEQRLADIHSDRQLSYKDH